MRFRILVGLASAMLVSISSVVMSSPIKPEVLEQGKELCAQAECAVKIKSWDSAFDYSTQALILLPESKRAKAVYKNAINELSRPSQDIKEIQDAILNLAEIAIAFEETRLDLSLKLADTVTDSYNGATKRLQQLNSLYDEYEEISETTVTETTTTTKGNTTIEKKRVRNGEKRNSIRHKESQISSAEEETAQFLNARQCEIDDIEMQHSQILRYIKNIDSDINGLYKLAVKTAVDQKSYKLALCYAKPLSERHSEYCNMVNVLSSICAAKNPELIGLADEMRFLATTSIDAGSFDIEMHGTRIKLLGSILDSHEKDSGGFDMSNYDFHDRNGCLRRFKVDSSGQIAYARPGTVRTIIVVCMNGSIFSGKWKKMQPNDSLADSGLPTSDLYVFYQEGSRLYREKLELLDNVHHS